MTIIIDSQETLRRTIHYCHDAIFDIDKINFNQDKRTFAIQLVRTLREEAILIKKVLFLKRWKAPRVKSILVFNNVVKVKFFSKEPDDFIVDIKYDDTKNQIEVECIKGTIIQLLVEKLEGKLQDISEKIF